MSSGLLALLDDVTTLVKATAASLDDISSQVAKTSGKVSGIVIDDAAVTPKYVLGLSPDREIFIIWSIAKKSLFNKIFILTPVALFLGNFLSWSITPLLMIGGSYLCYEGYEKIDSLLLRQNTIEDTEGIDSEEDSIIIEQKRISGAVRTDLILSSEIIAITYSNVLLEPLIKQVGIMLGVGFFLTVAVYGFVGIIVKSDDVGLYLAKGTFPLFIKNIGTFIVRIMPHFLAFLSYIGTFAMLLVGFGIITHGFYPLAKIQESIVSTLGHLHWSIVWSVNSLMTIFLGVVLGFCINLLIQLFRRIKKYNDK